MFHDSQVLSTRWKEKQSLKYIQSLKTSRHQLYTAGYVYIISHLYSFFFLLSQNQI